MLYDSEGAYFVQIRCRGRGEVPEPEAVNFFYWRVATFRAEQLEMVKRSPGNSYKPKAILVHCTHGFNRTGAL